MAKTIVGMFDGFDAARAAVEELTRLGVPERDISLVRQEDEKLRATATARTDDDAGTRAGAGAAKGAGTGAMIGGAAGLLAGLAGIAIPGLGPVIAAGWLASTLAGAGIGAVAGGLIGALVGAGVPESEAVVYEEGVRRGKTLVTIRADDEGADRIAEVLDRHGALDVDQTADEFARSGWKRETPARVGTQVAQGDVRVPVVEEQLQVGKRQVQRGGVRIHTHTTERPIEERVTLREERVHVERRPVGQDVDDPSLLDRDDEVIEVQETSEEAVVAKRARVVEEVVVAKESQEREEVVRDVVRRKDVEVEQVGGARGARFDEYDEDFHRHYNQALASRGLSYEQCAPAYRLGAELTEDEQNRRRKWQEVEPEARRRWEEHNPGTWTQVRDATRYSWDRLTGNA